MSLADRKKAAQEEEENKNKIENGDYRVRLKDWKFGKSKGGKEMYTLTWKILSKLTKKGAAATDAKGKERRTYYVISQNWALVALLDLLEQAGADLAKMEEVDEIDDVFEEIEDTKLPKADMALEHEEGKQFPKITITNVEKVLNQKCSTDKPQENDTEDEDPDDEETVTAPD
jgi:hypothetical protein